MKTLNITGVIGDWWDGVTEEDIIKQLDGHEGELDVVINSPGGFAYDGIAIYNRLKDYNPTVHVVGLAASAASIIAMAGKEVHMRTGSQMMIHNAWGGVIGGTEDIAKYADRLAKLNVSIADIYGAKTGDRIGAAEAMAAETWYTADEAREAGFATHIEGQQAEPEPTNMHEVLAAMGCKSCKLDEAATKAAARSADKSFARGKLDKHTLSLHPNGRGKNA